MGAICRIRHCEERSDEAIPTRLLRSFHSLAMTIRVFPPLTDALQKQDISGMTVWFVPLIKWLWEGGVPKIIIYEICAWLFKGSFRFARYPDGAGFTRGCSDAWSATDLIENPKAFVKSMKMGNWDRAGLVLRFLRLFRLRLAMTLGRPAASPHNMPCIIANIVTLYPCILATKGDRHKRRAIK